MATNAKEISTEVIQWNCNGIRSQNSELQILIKKYNPAIITLQETRTNNTTDYSIAGYDTLFYHRPSGQGGTAIAIKHGIKYSKIELNSNLEAIAIETNIPRKMSVCSIYLSPNQAINEKELDNIINSLPKPCMISGDFNAHHSLWGSPKEDCRGKTIEKIMKENELITLNDGSPTFIHTGAQNSSTCIDLTFCSAEIADKLNWEVLDDQHGSDHFPIVIGLSTHTTRTRTPRWKIHEANWNLFEVKINEFINHNQSYSIEEITDAIKTAAFLSIPKSSSESHTKMVPWWNQKVADAIKLRRKKLRKKQRTHPDDPTFPTILDEFQKARSNARKIIEEEKQKSWEEFASSINKDTPTKEIWKRIRAISKKGTSSHRTWAIDTSSGIIRDPEDIANHLAEHFYKESSNDTYHVDFQQKKQKEEKTIIKFKKQRNSEMDKDFSMSEMIFQIDKLTGTSPGPDEIHNAMLKQLPFYAKRKLLEAYNEIWKTGRFPELWRSSILVPIPKQGKCPNTPDNLRPICLSSCVLKLFERMVNRRLMHFLEKNKILGKEQFGFRKGHQTNDVITHIDNYARNAISEKKHSEIIFLDLQKAYDRTWRRLILKKLAKANVSGHMATFCSLFLERRDFQVRYEGQLSNTKTQENGVPQGSVLAVTFFLLAMESIKKFIPKGTFIRLYADDITIAVTTKSAKWTRDKIQKILNGIEKWCSETGFCVSVKKSAIMHVGKRRKLKKQATPLLNSEPINLVKQHKLLGVWMDDRLNYNYHTKITRDEVNRRMDIMKCLSRTKFGADRKSLLHILNMIILPKLTYGAPVLICPERQITTKLNPIYHQGIRYATGAFHSSPIESILSESGLLPLELRITKITTNYVSKQLARGILTPELHIVNKISSILNDLQTQLMNITNEDPTTQLNWEDSNYRINTDIPERLSPAAKQNYFKELCHTEYPNHLHIYTDGSKTDDGVGCGIFSHNLNLNTSICLPNHLSIFSAEAFAILKAIENCHRGLYVIFSDSKSVLVAVANNNPNHPWVTRIRNILQGKKGNIELCWVPAHVNIFGNEKADDLAKIGATLQDPLDIETPFADFKRLINTKIAQAWQNKWYVNQSKLRHIKNTTHEWNSSYNEDRHFSRILTRLRIGHTKLTHGHFAKKEDPAICTACGETTTVHHILIDCRLYETERQNNQLGNSLHELLGDDVNNLEKTKKFLRDCNLHKLI